MTQHQDVIAALAADGEEVDRLVAGLDASQWTTPTPAAGWTITHQIAHITATFRLAALAASDAEGFGKLAGTLSPDFDANVHAALSQFVNLPPSILACAGMMELFAHGQDIADALGVRPTRTDRLRYLVAFAVRTWDFGYLARGLETPAVEFGFDITGPSGARWTFGPADAEQRIAGPAEDFCLLVTRRRHRDDLAITATGPDADAWVDIAQAYRGPAGEGRAPGQFAEDRAA